jgi:hypothetical protein
MRGKNPNISDPQTQGEPILHVTRWDDRVSFAFDESSQNDETLLKGLPKRGGQKIGAWGNLTGALGNQSAERDDTIADSWPVDNVRDVHGPPGVLSTGLRLKTRYVGMPACFKHGYLWHSRSILERKWRINAHQQVAIIELLAIVVHYQEAANDLTAA